MYGTPSLWVNTHILGVPGGEYREKGAERLFEKIIAQTFQI